MRAKIIAAGAPYVQDAVLTGINLKEVGALIFPTQAVRQLAGLAARRRHAAGARERTGAGALPAGRRHAGRRAPPAAPTASHALHLMAEPPSIDKGEVTDKGSINQRAVLKHRAALADALHDGTLPFHRSSPADHPSRRHKT